MLRPNELKICQTVYANEDRHKLKIEPDVIDNPVKPVIR